MSTIEEADCPVCGEVFRQVDLEAHCQTHFGSAQQEEEPICIDDDSPEGVMCPFGCGAVLSMDEVASHEEAHR